MADAKVEFKNIVCNGVKEFCKEKNIEITGEIESLFEKIVVQNAPNPEMGDLGSPMFIFSKVFKMPPVQIASGVVEFIKDCSLGEVLAVGPYVNIKLDKSGAASDILKAICKQKDDYGSFLSDGTFGWTSCNGGIFFAKYKQTASSWSSEK